MKRFENEEIRGLITTDVMARGLDISNITHVINFETPDIPEQYIHRIGRTGRADKEGKAITFVTKKEEPLILDIELLMDKELQFNDFPEGVKINPAKIASEKDEVVMKNPVQVKLNEGGGAFHEKKAKNTKENWGGPSKEKLLKSMELTEHSRKQSLNRRERNNKKRQIYQNCRFLLFHIRRNYLSPDLISFRLKVKHIFYENIFSYISVGILHCFGYINILSIRLLFHKSFDLGIGFFNLWPKLFSAGRILHRNIIYFNIRESCTYFFIKAFVSLYYFICLQLGLSAKSFSPQ